MLWEICVAFTTILLFFSFSSLVRFWYLLWDFFIVFLCFFVDIYLIIFYLLDIFIYMITNIKNYKKNTIKDGFIGTLKTSLLNFNFVEIYEIYKVLVLFKNHLNYLQYRNFEWFFRSIIDFFFWAGQKKMIWKNLRKIIQKLLLIFCMLKKKKCTLFIFWNITQIVKTKL